MFLEEIPPSTSMRGDTPWRSHMALSSWSFAMVPGIKLWPPKPGFTLISSTISTTSMMLSSTQTGVAGLSTTPALMPRCCRCVSVRCRCVEAS